MSATDVEHLELSVKSLIEIVDRLTARIEGFMRGQEVPELTKIDHEFNRVLVEVASRNRITAAKCLFPLATSCNKLLSKVSLLATIPNAPQLLNVFIMVNFIFEVYEDSLFQLSVWQIKASRLPRGSLLRLVGPLAFYGNVGIVVERILKDYSTGSEAPFRIDDLRKISSTFSSMCQRIGRVGLFIDKVKRHTKQFDTELESLSKGALNKDRLWATLLSTAKLLQTSLDGEIPLTIDPKALYSVIVALRMWVISNQGDITKAIEDKAISPWIDNAMESHHYFVDAMVRMLELMAEPSWVEVQSRIEVAFPVESSIDRLADLFAVPSIISKLSKRTLQGPGLRYLTKLKIRNRVSKACRKLVQIGPEVGENGDGATLRAARLRLCMAAATWTGICNLVAGVDDAVILAQFQRPVLHFVDLAADAFRAYLELPVRWTPADTEGLLLQGWGNMMHHIGKDLCFMFDDFDRLGDEEKLKALKSNSDIEKILETLAKGAAVLTLLPAWGKKAVENDMMEQALGMATYFTPAALYMLMVVVTEAPAAGDRDTSRRCQEIFDARFPQVMRKSYISLKITRALLKCPLENWTCSVSEEMIHDCDGTENYRVNNVLAYSLYGLRPASADILSTDWSPNMTEEQTW